EGVLICPGCSRRMTVKDLAYDPPWGFGYLAFEFWNWGGLRLDSSAKSLGCSATRYRFPTTSCRIDSATSRLRAGVEKGFERRIVGVAAAAAHDDYDVAIPPDRLVSGQRAPLFGRRAAAGGKVPVL